MSRRAGRRARAALVATMMAWTFASVASADDLLELYSKARQFDPAFQTARLEQEVAEQVLREARAGLKPTLSASVDLSAVNQNIQSSDNFLFQEGRSDFFNQNYSISLVQPLYQPEVLSRLPQAQAENRAAAFRYAAAEQDLIYRLAQALFSFLAASDNLEFAASERVAIRQQLERSEERLGSGLGTLTDVHEARARFALAQATEIEAENALDEARLALAEITGEIPTDLVELSETFPLVQPDRPDADAWVEAAMFQNPALAAQQAAADVAEQEIRRQKAASRPRLDLVASYSDADSGGTSLGSGDGNEISTADVSVRLGIPIFDGGRWPALARAAELRHQAALQELERLRRRVERETRVAFQGVMTGITRIQALNQSVFSQESALSAREEALQSGVGTGIDVLDARRDLFLAKRDLAQARYVYILNSLRLKQSVGVLTEIDLRQINGFLQ